MMLTDHIEGQLRDLPGTQRLLAPQPDPLCAPLQRQGGQGEWLPGKVVAVWHLCALVGLTLCLAAEVLPEPIRSGEILAADDFDRFDQRTFTLGSLPVGEVRWGQRDLGPDGEPMTHLISAADGELHIRYSSGRQGAPGVYLDGLTVADGVIRVTVGRSLMTDRTNRAIITYRAQTLDDLGYHGPNAYHVELAGDWSGSRDVLLRHGREVIAAGNVADARAPDSVHRVQVAFAGHHHQVNVDGVPVIDFWEFEPGRNQAGMVGLGQYYSMGAWDEFELTAATTDLTKPPVDTSSGRIPPLIFQGRPFFPLGTFDRPRAEDLAEWLEAGGNTVIVSAFRDTAPPEERQADVRRLAQWGEDNGVAMAYFPQINFYSRDGDQTIPTRPEEIPPKVELINEMLAITAPHPNTLGYWTFDEPENHLYRAYRDWEDRGDQGLAEWIADTMAWTYDAFKAGDPDRYVMPTIAWWTTYEDLAPLYDVNVPNEYPCRVGDGHLQGNLYTVNFDAVRAADAVRSTGRHSFVYMPPCFDIIMAPWRAASLAELRYCYLAPVTRGAMGVLSWRLGRSSPAYRQAVVYPVMREVKRLIPWLLGEWHDEKVTSNRDTATAEYLTEFPERIMLLPGEEDAPMVQAEEDAVPDCSHCLRRRPDNTYLLLAVNNRREPLDVTFTIHDIPGLPETTREMLNWYELPMEDGTITQTLEPFGVRAYLIEPR